MNIINLTPHAITIIGENKNLVIEPSGIVTRIGSYTKTVGLLIAENQGPFEIPVTVTKYDEVENLPDPVNNTSTSFPLWLLMLLKDQIYIFQMKLFVMIKVELSAVNLWVCSKLY